MIPEVGDVTHFWMESISLAMWSRSLMALKSLLNPESAPKSPNPNAALAVTLVVEVPESEEVGGAERAVMLLKSGVDIGRSDVTDELVGAEVVGVAAEGVGGATVCCLRSEGGIMLAVSSLGTSLPRTFSAIRNMARANCSAFSLPFF